MLLKRLSSLTLERRWIACLGLAILLTGCAGRQSADETANWTNDRLYTEAISQRDSGNFERAVTLFEKLEGRAAGTPLAQQAQLEKAFAHYRAGEQAQAIATLQRFMRVHPASPAMDYALYLKGLVNFNDNLGLFGFLSRQDLSERDQQSARESFDAFRELVERFPDSRYAPDARLRMTHIINSLAQSEVHIARHYLSRGAYVAAINRAQAAVTEFDGVPAAEEALSILWRAYQALGMTDMANDTRRILEQNFPDSVFLNPGSRQQRERGSWLRLW